jgi:HEPN domain-containing protein
VLKTNLLKTCYSSHRVNRRELQGIAQGRLKDAQLLFEHKRFDGAYYLAGYVIECALKACIAKKTKRYDFPDREFFKNVYIHDLSRLLEPAGLKNQFEQEFQTDRTLEVKWGVVKDWKETSRYQVHGRRKAKDILEAVADPHGVLDCIKRYW